MIAQEIARAHAATLREWALLYRSSDGLHTAEAAKWLERAAAMCRAVAGDPAPDQEPVAEPPLSKPRADDENLTP